MKKKTLVNILSLTTVGLLSSCGTNETYGPLDLEPPTGHVYTPGERYVAPEPKIKPISVEYSR